MLAVTTRNQLRSARFCVPMLLARREIARQLAHQPGLVRYASGLASPTEFYTVTVWRDRESMQRFMQSGAHERNMWQFTRWTSSFWGMRWDPLGHAAALLVSPVVTAGLLAPRPERVSLEPRAAGIACVTAIFDGISGVTQLRAASTQLLSDTRLLRLGAGVDFLPRGMAIALWQGEPDPCQEMLGGASWVSAWQAGDYEIGHWDGLRLRQVARRRTRDRVESGQ